MAKRMSKRERRKRTVRVILILVIVAVVLAFGVRMLRNQVTSKVNEDNDQPQSATVQRGSITSTVSGSGNLADEDVETVSIYSGVEIQELLVEAGDAVSQGDVLATVNMSTVLSSMAQVQSQINTLDAQIAEASTEELDDTIQTAVPGRVMALYAQAGDDVSTVMYENGALALISLDGYLQLELETDALAVGDAVSLTDDDGNTVTAAVGSVSQGVASILVSDSKFACGQTVTATDSQGATVGSGVLDIHQPMKITGVAGTVKAVKVSENQSVKAGKTLFTLTNTSFSANYLTLLEERETLEEQLMQLIQIYRDGAVLAQISGTVSNLGSSSDASGSYTGYSAFGTAQSGSGASGSGSSGTDTTLLSICPGTKMTVSISVDETDILSLALGQQASVSVDALEDESVTGTLTQIDTTATSSGGVTVYTVTVTLDKSANMLSGMTASVAIIIEGVEDALLIPSDALTQTSAKSYVYTSYDQETGELGGMVEVTVGLNNGGYVEILSGLSEGDTVYYAKSGRQSFGFGSGGFGSFGGNSGGFGGDFGSFGGNTGGFGGNTGRPGGSGNTGGRGQ